MTASKPVVERASATDRAFLAMDGGRVPEQFGVLLRLTDAERLDLEQVRRVLDARVPAVPRLRQRLVGVPFGCGGPIWVDDAGFDVRRHVQEVACPAPADEPALLAAALDAVNEPLPREAPLWRAVLVTGLDGGERALVIVLHHVLSDGVGGLDVLAGLVDPGARAADVPFPRARPGRRLLARDALRSHLAGLRRARRAWGLLRASLGAGGGVHPPRATPCSLNGRTGPRRVVAVVRADLTALRTSAHRHGATTNDAVLVALAGALHRVLSARGELVDSLVVTVPVSGRRADSTDSGGALGNMVSPLLVEVPTTGDLGERLAQVAARVRAGKASATGPPPIALLGWLFRPMARLGLFRLYMNHQHRYHVLASHVRGPVEPVRFSGAPITAAVPLGIGEGGNATITFEILSYAGGLAIVAIADPDHWSDLATLTHALRSELDLLVAAPA